jgi:hypothetical protein
LALPRSLLPHFLGSLLFRLRQGWVRVCRLVATLCSADGRAWPDGCKQCFAVHGHRLLRFCALFLTCMQAKDLRGYPYFVVEDCSCRSDPGKENPAEGLCSACTK